MSVPTVGHKRKLKRVARYLSGRRRVVWKYAWQGRPEAIEVYTDSDWAGCAKTRKSTSGGVIKVGSHVVKTWSRTQKAVALSSGEAEVIPLVMGVSEASGLQRMAETWGAKYGIVGLCDSTAAMGICERKGVGRIRHLDVGMMWIQDLRADGGVSVKKVKGTENPADQLTKYLGKENVESRWRS